MIESLKIVALGLVVAVGYGIAHDQVTTRVSIEYFTIGHPPIFNTDSPTLLAFGWGVIATWRLGAMLGLVTAAFARLGSRPKISARQLLRPVACLVLLMATMSLVFGILGYLSAAQGAVRLDDSWALRVPERAHNRFVADLWAHRAAYLTSYFGSVFVWAWIARRRRRQAAGTERPPSGVLVEENRNCM